MIDGPPLLSDDDDTLEENVSSFNVKDTITKMRPKNNRTSSSHETGRIIKGTESEENQHNTYLSNPVSSTQGDENALHSETSEREQDDNRYLASNPVSPTQGGVNALHNETSEREKGEISHFDTGQLEAPSDDNDVTLSNYIPEFFDESILLSFRGNTTFFESLEGSGVARDRSDSSIIISDVLYGTAEICSGLVTTNVSFQYTTADPSVYLTTAYEESTWAKSSRWVCALLK